jgi:hypothetical protein
MPTLRTPREESGRITDVQITGVAHYAITTNRDCTVGFFVGRLLLGEEVRSYRAALRSVEWVSYFPSTAEYTDDGQLVVTFEVQRAGEVVARLDDFMAAVNAEWQQLQDEVTASMEAVRTALAARFGEDAVPS